MQRRSSVLGLAAVVGLAITLLSVSRAQADSLISPAVTKDAPDQRGLAEPPDFGDILICDVFGGKGLVAFKPSTNAIRTISSGGLLSSPTSVAIESFTSALVSVLGGKIVRVDLSTGAQQLVTSGGLLTNPDGVTLGRDGVLYVSDIATNRIVAVNTSTGAQRLVSTDGLLAAPIFLIPVGNDSLLVSSNLDSRVTWIRISDGAQSIAASGGNLQYPAGMALDTSDRLLVVDHGTRKLSSIDLTNGAQELITSSLTGLSMGLVYDGLGSVYIGNFESSTTALTKVNLFTGARVPIATPLMSAFGMVLVGASDGSPEPPESPASFVASDGEPYPVRLSWTAATGAAAYRLYRDGQQIAAIPAMDSTYLDDVAIGTYTYCIEAVNPGGSAEQVCDVGSRRAFRPNPDIQFVKDVPNDQGGKLAIGWLRSEYDAVLVHSITGYRIWRRLPVSDGVAAGAILAERVGSAETRVITDGQSITYWEALRTVPAAFLEGYGVVEASTQDSLPDSNPHTAFFVSALTSDPFEFYDSAIDSGYSVDNLAPAPPAGLHGTIAPAVGITLHWLPNRETDLASYAIYHGPNADFEPSPANQLGSTPDTIFAAGMTAGSYYKVSAVDIHGNESPFSTLAPTDLPTTTLVTNIEAETEGASVTITVGLSSSAAGLSAILYRGTSDLFAAARPVPNASISVTGESVELHDVTVTAGGSYWYWVQLVGSDGLVVLAGPVAASVGNAPAFTALRTPEPNPMVNQTMLRYALGTDVAGSGTAPCRIEIFTVQGRRVRALESSVRVAGSYETQWDGKDDQGAPLRGGVYYVRLTAGSVRKSCKLVLAK